MCTHKAAKLQNQNLGFVKSQWDPQGKQSFIFLILSSFEIIQLKNILFSIQGKLSPKNKKKRKKRTESSRTLNCNYYSNYSQFVDIKLRPFAEGFKIRKENKKKNWLFYLLAGFISRVLLEKNRHKGHQIKLLK